MTDPRWGQLGDLLVNYSMGVRTGERVMIAMKEVESFPLVRAIYSAVIRAGAFAQVQFLSDILSHELMWNGSREQISWIPEVEKFGMEWADVYFGVRGAHNLNEFWDIDSTRLSSLRQSMGKISALRNEKTRWCLIPIPSESMAVQSGTDFSSLMEMFFNACLRDWHSERAAWVRIANRLEHGQCIHLLGRDTDLSFSLEGMHWAVDAGESNMPGGEIWTAPVPSSLNGKIFFEFPGVLGGRLVKDIRLEWKDGILRHASASSNEDYLHQIVKMDAGASLLGEFAFGTNPAIDRWCNDILLDEKMGGTVHVALGRAYPEVGGTNQSALHWDIIKDTRKEGIVFLDDEKIFENGAFLMS
jgi:aminopeptidase